MQSPFRSVVYDDRSRHAAARPPPTGKRRDRELFERSTRRIAAELRASAPSGALGPLRAVEHEPATGSKPLYLLENARGERVVLKVADRPLMMAEQVVDGLRQLASRPSIPARIAEVDIERLGRVEGLLKPFISFDAGQCLSSDSTEWSPLQRSVVLAEHAWEWFVGNLDANTQQFALIGAEAYPVNIDWDRAFHVDAPEEVTRFAKYRQTLPNAHTFLYSDYVEGRISLDLGLLAREARQIRWLPSDRVEELLLEYASTRYDEADDQRAFARRMMRRKASIEHAFIRFSQELVRERTIVLGAGDDLPSRARVRLLLAWHQWQVVLDAAAHGRAARRARSVLKWIRARSLGQPVSLRG